jgi:ATP-dependent 26S proteasome regulatory subunit
MSAEPDPRDKALADYKQRLLQHKEVDSKVRALRDDVKTVKKEYDKTEDDLKALQSVGQIIGEVLRKLDEERCESMRCAAGRWQAAAGRRDAAVTAPPPPASAPTQPHHALLRMQSL